MTLNQKYYAMNTALINGLIAQGIFCPVFKYGIAPDKLTYPYIQTTYRVTKRQPNGSVISGTLIDFEYTLNFFTAAGNERENDAALFIPYETARELIITPGLMIWDGITNVLNHDETPEFNFKGGLEVLMRGLIFKCQSVVSHVVTDQTTYTTIDGAMDVVESSLNYE